MIQFPADVKSTPCKTMTRSYFNTKIGHRVEVSVEAKPMVKVRLVSVNMLCYITKETADTFQWDPEFLVLVDD